MAVGIISLYFDLSENLIRKLFILTEDFWLLGTYNLTNLRTTVGTVAISC